LNFSRWNIWAEFRDVRRLPFINQIYVRLICKLLGFGHVISKPFNNGATGFFRCHDAGQFANGPRLESVVMY
jgi:hypothetical protein